MPLSDTAVRNARPAEKPQKLSDERGLYLLVTPAGGKLWRFKYRFAGREKLLAFGAYPEVPLKLARERRDEARAKLARGVDPGAERSAARHTASGAGGFEAVAREWHKKQAARSEAEGGWTPSHATTVMRRLERDVFPWLGAKPVADVTAPDILACLARVEARGAIETAHRIKQICGQVMRFAAATGRAPRDPTPELRGALAPVPDRHFATILEPAAIGALLRALDAYVGHHTTRCALRLAPLVFVRPGELRHAEWAEFNLDAAEWRIPAAKMKMRLPHIVPLSRQALAILRDVEPLTGRGRYVFPSVRGDDRPMSNGTVLAALQRLGYSGEQMTGHGFRHMASTLLNEMKDQRGWSGDAIERQLAHVERNSVRGTYNYAEYLPQRREIMQAWADHLDRLRSLR